MKENIYLVGFMGTGKTAVGKLLAKQLNLKFVEMDQLIEQEEAKPISEIFKLHGEAYFRAKERQLLEKIAIDQGQVISCGGGLICNQDNADLMKQTGTIICLQTSLEKIYQRIKHDTTRPLLNVADPLEKIKELMFIRQPFYRQADYTVESENQTPQQVADEIVTRLEL